MASFFLNCTADLDGPVTRGKATLLNYYHTYKVKMTTVTVDLFIETDRLF